MARTISDWQRYREHRDQLPKVWLVENTEDGIVYGAYDSKESAEIEFGYRKRTGERLIVLRSYPIQTRETATMAGWANVAAREAIRKAEGK